MHWISFTAIWTVGLAFILLSSGLLFYYKRPECTVKQLRTHTVGYWYKNLHILVHREWIRPIQQLAWLGVFVLLSDLLLFLIVNMFGMNLESVWFQIFNGIEAFIAGFTDFWH